MYNLNLPGFSLEDFKENLHQRGIEHTGFTNDEIENGLTNLLNEKVFEPIVEYDGQTRYVMVDENLNIFAVNFLLLCQI